MKVKHYLEYYLLIGLTYITFLIGSTGTRKVGRVIAYLFFYLIPIRKEVVLKNLRIAFPQNSDNEIKVIAKENYVRFACSFLEIGRFYFSRPDDILDKLEPFDLSVLKELGESGKGIIFLTAHFGNWELGALMMGLVLEKSITVLAKDQKNKLVAQRLRQMREKFGNKEVYLGTAVRELYKSIVNGNPIGIVADQRAPKNSSVKVNFFGCATSVFSGFGNLALKLRPPIFIVLLAHQQSGRYKVYFEEITYDDLPEGKDEGVKELTQRYMTKLESFIRKYPEQWFWMHNIWKH